MASIKVSVNLTPLNATILSSLHEYYSFSMDILVKAKLVPNYLSTIKPDYVST